MIHANTTAIIDRYNLLIPVFCSSDDNRSSIEALSFPVGAAPAGALGAAASPPPAAAAAAGPAPCPCDRPLPDPITSPKALVLILYLSSSADDAEAGEATPAADAGVTGAEAAATGDTLPPPLFGTCKCGEAYKTRVEKVRRYDVERAGSDNTPKTHKHEDTKAPEPGEAVERKWLRRYTSVGQTAHTDAYARSVETFTHPHAQNIFHGYIPFGWTCEREKLKSRGFPSLSQETSPTGERW